MGTKSRPGPANAWPSKRKLAGGGGFDGGENRPALAYELVKLEGEGSSTIVASEVAATR